MRYILALIVLCTLASCSPNAQKKAAEIDQLEKVLLDNAKKNIADTAKVRELLVRYDEYQATFPKDTNVPNYLMKAAEFYRYMQQPDKALYCYHRVANDFPEYPKSGLALFLEGFIYENDKHEYARAATLYNDYLKKYPKSKLASSVEFSLKNLGKTPEQIMAEMDSSRVDTAATASH